MSCRLAARMVSSRGFVTAAKGAAMVRRPLSVSVLVAAAFALALILPATAGAATPKASAPATPSISVYPLAGLSAGSQVTVHLRGLPAGATVRFVQCDNRYDPTNDQIASCGGSLPTAQANTYGRVTARLTLQDPLYLEENPGEFVIYCRADQCRLFAVWTDTSGGVHWLSSLPMYFVGSPATIAAKPSSGLLDGQRVRVAGTAIAGHGRTVVILEGDCYDLIQGRGCEGTITLGTTQVGLRGGWQLSVHVARVLPDGIDCTDPGDYILDSNCKLTAQVLTKAGQPDDTYGVSRFGEPGAILSFLPPSN
jgi:hypothetical protein